MADKIAKRGVSIFIDGKEVKNSVAGITGEMRKLQGEQRKMTIGSDEYVAHGKKIEYLKKLHLEHIQNQRIIALEYGNMKKESESSLSKMANGFNKYFAIVTAGIAMFTGLTLGLKKFMDMRNELEDSQANLKSLTGLDDDSITWLTAEAKKLSTQMTDSGVRIRKSSKEIIDAFTVVGSAKPELLKNKEALKEVTEQAMILAEASKMELGDAVRGLTIAMNMYGASASEAAKYTNVLGAGAKEGAAEVSSQTESILKAGVAASQAGIPIEQLVGSIQALAEKGIKDEIAGTGMKSFFIKLQSGADDTNPKIVGLQKALENLAAKNLSSAEIQKRFGLETYTVASALITAADKVNFYTKAVTGTNTALEQAQINSQTTAAKLAQARNEFNEAGMKLVENLNPALLKATNLTTQFVKALSSAAAGTKSMTQQYEEQSSKVLKLKTNIEPLLSRYDELALKANRSTAENSELKKIVDKVALAMPGAVTAVDKYGNAIAISTGRVREFINTEVARLGVVHKAAIEENKDNLNDVVAQIARTKKKIDEINKTGTFTYDKVDKKTGDYITFKATPEMIRQTQESYKKLLQDKVGYEEEIRNLSGATLAKQVKEQQAQLKAQEKAAAEAAKIEADKQKALEDAANGSDGSTSEETKEKAFKKAEDAIEASGKRRQILTDDMYASLNMSEFIYEQMSLVNTADMLREKEKLYKKYGKDTADIEKQLSDVRLKQFEIDKKHKENYEKALENVKKLDLPKPTEDDPVIDTENYTVALRLKILEAFHRKGLRSEEEYQKELAGLLQGNQEEINKYLKDVNLQNNEERFRQGLIGEKQYLDNNRQIYADYIDEKFAKEQQLAQDISAVANAAADISAAMQDAALMRVDNKYAKELEAAKKAGKDTTALEAKIEEEKKQVKKKYADVDFAITAAQIIASTASAVMNALKIPPPFGQILAGIVGASGIAQLAIANQQRQSIKNLWTGGFTGSGGKYEPKGVVHGNEFVANSEALANPNLMPVFSAIDAAQRMGTVNSMKPRDLRRALRQESEDNNKVVRRSSSGGSASVSSSPAVDFEKSIERLNNILDNGIEARSVISGQTGSYEQTKKYEWYKLNGQRK